MNDTPDAIGCIYARHIEYVSIHVVCCIHIESILMNRLSLAS